MIRPGVIDPNPKALKHVRLSETTYHTLWTAYWLYGRFLQDSDGSQKSLSSFVFDFLYKVDIRFHAAKSLMIGVCFQAFYRFRPPKLGDPLSLKVIKGLQVIETGTTPQVVQKSSCLTMKQVRQLGEIYYYTDLHSLYGRVIKELMRQMKEEIGDDNVKAEVYRPVDVMTRERSDDAPPRLR